MTILIIICAHLPSVAEIAKPRGDVVLGALCGPVDSRRIATTTVAAEEALLIIAKALLAISKALLHISVALLNISKAISKALLDIS